MFEDIFVAVDVNMQKRRAAYLLIITVKLKCMNKIKQIMTVVKYKNYSHV